MAVPDLVSQTIEASDRSTHQASVGLPPIAPANVCTPPAPQETAPQGLQAVRGHYASQGLSEDIIDFLVLAWRAGTRRQYDCYLKKWLYHCNSMHINPVKPDINEVLTYLLSQFNAGLSYSTLGTIRSALSHIIKFNGEPVGQHPLVRLFMKSAAQQRPKLTKDVTWEVNDVLNYLRMVSPIESLSLEQLTKKTLMLMAILSGQRGQTFHVLSTENLSRSDHFVTFRIKVPLKTTRLGFHFSELKFKAFPCDRRLCVVSYINAYLSRTDCFRKGDITKFFITYGVPNKGASRDSIRRWTKDVLRDAGIDLSIFNAHSTRSAATSAARTLLPLETVLKAGGWSTANTFTRYYNLRVVDGCAMQSALLNRNLNSM